MKNGTIKKITFTAIMIALGTALSALPVIQMPFGGKMTIVSMLPVMLVVLKYDFKWGLFSTFLYSVIQMFLSLAEVLGWGLSPLSLVACIMLDYILAYTVLVLAGCFKKHGKVGVIIGVIVALLARYLMHIISGMVLWGYVTEKGFWGALWYSLGYNGAFMIPELIFTPIVVGLLLASGAYRKIMEY